MKKTFGYLAAVAVLAGCAGSIYRTATDHGGAVNAGASLPAPLAGAAATPRVLGGATMFPDRNILDNLVHSRDHTTLVAAIFAGGLADRLRSGGPFTVLAPTDDAVRALPPATSAALTAARGSDLLDRFLDRHVLPGRLDATTLRQRIAAGGGKAALTTGAGDTLAVTEEGGTFTLVDRSGIRARLTVTDIVQANGVIHGVAAVLLPD